MFTVKRNIEALIHTTEEDGLEASAEKTNMVGINVRVNHQNAGQNHNMKRADTSSENAEKFKYPGKTTTRQKCINDENENRLISRNPSDHN
jgi:hypothetical protein